ncbi:hypothetical protein HYC85_028432 [Camellia sinensis]|uniref:Uncharacterized protein n=1 Tax=Camellia sinensis TaxID=4442 RepID=A0A7J7FWC3_CAMSI|nr:hypothetical protein HYC85_028432 [Camellia sinensis]
MISCFDYTYVFLFIACALVRLGHRVCHQLFLNGLPEARFEKRAIRLTGQRFNSRATSVLSLRQGKERPVRAHGLRPVLKRSAHLGHLPHIQPRDPSRTLIHFRQLKICMVRIPKKVKIANLEKQFKKAQGLNSIPDIEDGYIEAPYGSQTDSKCHILTVSMGLEILWLEDKVKQNWEELAEAFVDQYSYSTQVEMTITSEPIRRVFAGSTNVGSSAIPKPTEINTIATADPFANPSLQTAGLARAQGRTFTPLYMSLTSALKVLTERGYLKPLDPQPLPDLLPARHNPSKYCVYHQQRGHGTDRCYRLRHEVQNLIDNRTIAPPLGPNDQTSPAHLNLIHILPSTYDPSIYITSAHLPKPEVFIPESMDLCMMDLDFGILALSLTTPHTGNFMSKGSPILGRAAFEESQTLGKVEGSGKNKVGAGMDPHEHLLLAVEALKAKGLNKEQVLAVVAKTVDDTFATQVRGSLNQGASREKGCCTRNVPFSSNPVLGRDQQTQSAPANPFAGASSKNPQTLKYQRRGQRVFHALYMPLSKVFQILVGQGHLKPLEPRPLPNPPPAMHDAAQYCVFHQQTGHAIDNCFRLRHEVQDLIDNEVIVAPGRAKSIGT